MDQGFPTWCDCGWNLAVRGKERKGLHGLLDRLHYARAARLFDEAMRHDPPPPRRLGALTVLSLAILATTPLLLLGAVALVAWLPNQPLAWFVGLLSCALAVYLRPRVEPLPDPAIDPADHPALMRLVREVSEAFGIAPPGAVVLTADYGASARHAGWGAQRVLVLGVPLLGVLDAAGRVAVVSHVLARFASGDSARGRLHGLAHRTVVSWVDLLEDSPSDHLGERILWLGFWALSWVPWTLAAAFERWAFDDSQRAVYRADRLAAGIAGGFGYARVLEQYLSVESYVEAVTRVGMGATDRHVVDELRFLLDTLPPRERERRMRVAAELGDRVDEAQPSTPMRIAAIQASPREATLVLHEQWAAELEGELTAHYLRVTRELGNAYRWAHS